MNKSLDSLERFRKDFPADFAKLDEMSRDYDARVAKLSLAGTPLSIGIIGQVKAGKSSFLNALLFKGEAVLPKAATPKTANLTRIRYGEQAALVVRTDRKSNRTTPSIAPCPILKLTAPPAPATEGKTGRFRVFLHGESGCNPYGMCGSSSTIRSTSQIHPEIDAGMVSGAVEHKARRFLLLILSDQFAIEQPVMRILRRHGFQCQGNYYQGKRKKKCHPKVFDTAFLPTHKVFDNQELKNRTFYPRIVTLLFFGQRLIWTYVFC